MVKYSGVHTSVEQYSTVQCSAVQCTGEAAGVAELRHLHELGRGVEVRGGDEADPDQLLQESGVSGGRGGGEVAPAGRSPASGRWPRGAAGPRTA